MIIWPINAVTLTLMVTSQETFLLDINSVASCKKTTQQSLFLNIYYKNIWTNVCTPNTHLIFLKFSVCLKKSFYAPLLLSPFSKCISYTRYCYIFYKYYDSTDWWSTLCFGEHVSKKTQQTKLKTVKLCYEDHLCYVPKQSLASFSVFWTHY